MPIYEFECGSCGARFEGLVDAGTEATECAECGAPGAERRMSMFGVISRQPTAGQRRRMEDKRGTNRGGARARWQGSMDRARARGSAEKRKDR